MVYALALPCTRLRSQGCVCNFAEERAGNPEPFSRPAFCQVWWGFLASRHSSTIKLPSPLRSRPQTWRALMSLIQHSRKIQLSRKILLRSQAPSAFLVQRRGNEIPAAHHDHSFRFPRREQLSIKGHDLLPRRLRGGLQISVVRRASKPPPLSTFFQIGTHEIK